MGLLDTSLSIGRSGIMAHSLAMDVVGNNIANSGTEAYARQVVDLRSALGVKTTQGPYLGLGVNADRIRRISDFYLEQRLRDARSDLESLKTQDEVFQRLEGAFNELTDNDLSTAMNSFFSALNTLQTNPEERSVRRSVVESARTFVETIQALRTKMDDLRKSLDSELTGAVDTVNSITTQLAELNVEISRLEGGEGNAGAATALRDRRDLLLGQLSDIIEVRAIEQGNGMVNVFAGSDPLVMNDRSFDIATETRADRSVLVSDVVFAEDGRPVALKGGQLQGLVEARDKGLVEFVDAMDAWAGTFIDEFNRIHASGQGLDLYTHVAGAAGVDDPLAALNAAGLDFTPQTGTFEINVKNATSGETKTFRFHVDLDGLNGDDTTLSSLVADINGTLGAAFPEVVASVGPGNALDIRSNAAELSFSFSNDTSGALACLGVNTFFTGSNSGDIGLNDVIDSNPGFIAAATTDMPGDNSNITKMLAFQNAPLTALSGTSVEGYYQGIVSTLGIRAASFRDRHVGSQAIQAAIQSQREALSGVSIDEEAVKLIRYQSGYTASARFITAVDELIQVLLNM